MLLKLFAAFGFFTDLFLSNAAKMQTYDKARNAVALALSPVVKALVDPDGAMRDIRNLDSVRGFLFFFCFCGSFCSCDPSEDLSLFFVFLYLFFFWFLRGTL